MRGRGIGGLVMVVILVLGSVYVYNRFSGKNVADLGRPAAA